MSESPDGLRASRTIVRRSAQALARAIDGMLWAVQNMPEADALRRHLVGCKAELNRALKSSGYTLEVQDGFSTKVRKVRPLAASIAAARIVRASRCPYGEYSPFAPPGGVLVPALAGICTCYRCQADRERRTAESPPMSGSLPPGAEDEP